MLNVFQKKLKSFFIQKLDNNILFVVITSSICKVPAYIKLNYRFQLNKYSLLHVVLLSKIDTMAKQSIFCVVKQSNLISCNLTPIYKGIE